MSNSGSLLSKLNYILFMFYTISIFIFSFKIEYVAISNNIFVLYAASALLKIIIKGKIQRNKIYIFTISFVFYSFLSCLWAVDPVSAFQKSNSLFLLICFSLITYQVFDKGNSINFILISIMVAGVAMELYSVFFYDFFTIVDAIITGQRLGGEINQANTFGIYLAFTCVISAYYAIYKKKSLFYLITMTSFLLILSSGSRTGLAIGFLGLVLLFYFRSSERRQYQGLLLSVFIGLLLFSILQLSIFDEATIRMQQLASIFSTDKNIDNSATVRLFMIEFGINKFMENPIIGYGAESSRFLLETIYGNTYLHNNYVEILVNYGLLGFLFYYITFLIILYKAWNGAKRKNPESIIVTVLFIMILISDYGTVSYYDKLIYIILTAGFIHIKQPSSLL